MTITEPGIYLTRDGREVTILEVRENGAVGRYWDEFNSRDRFGLWMTVDGLFLGLVNGAESPARITTKRPHKDLAATCPAPSLFDFIGRFSARPEPIPPFRRGSTQENRHEDSCSRRACPWPDGRTVSRARQPRWRKAERGRTWVHPRSACAGVNKRRALPDVLGAEGQLTVKGRGRKAPSISIKAHRVRSHH